MKIAIVHYHLRRGGVTQVIATAIEALQKFGHEIVVLSGEMPPPEIAGKIPNIEVVKNLGYKNSGSLDEARTLARELQTRAGNPDVWHFHNHALGKNVLMPQVVFEIARETPVLLQIHDFAEDGRPENFERQLAFDSEAPLWPQASQIHYATINQRDQKFLAGATLLANAVSEIQTEATPENRPFAEGKKFYLYPTRAIRRKNIGELLLHAHFHRADAVFATTLVPENSDWLAIHQHWESVVKKMDLPVILGNHGHKFTDLIGWADAHITTSVAEGFGLAFLEPWLAGKSVVGRDLPEITADFPIQLDHLYPRFDVPLDLINFSDLKSEIKNGLEKSYTAYGRTMPFNAVKTALESMIHDEQIDFGRLSEPFQTTILENPRGIEPPTIEPCSSEAISEQTGLVLRTYRVDSYGEKLNRLYQTIAKSHIGEIENSAPDRLLDSFLDPAQINLLRT